MITEYISHKSKKKVVIAEMVDQYLINSYNFYSKLLKEEKDSEKVLYMEELKVSLKAEIDKRGLAI